ncbi:10360_t:CDS:2 [Paraglomus occultum]|uniref:10360_t:CDS:1 n=1 Tax=Paraglomus occultum TaxID=144539 RepID=A0A9N9CE33_9GLOM|nr:10360_t:CDS:2 [Paraglomus occultum]
MATGSQGYVENVVSETNQEIASSQPSFEVSGHQEVRHSNVSSATQSIYGQHLQEQPVLGRPVVGHDSYLGQPVQYDALVQREPSPLSHQFQSQQEQVQRVPTPLGQQLQREPSPIGQQFQREPSPLSQQSQRESSSPPKFPSNPSPQDQYYPPPAEPPPPDVVPLVPPYSPSSQLSTASNSPHLSNKPITGATTTYPNSMVPGQNVTVDPPQRLSEIKSEASSSPPKKQKKSIFRNRKFWIGLIILIVLILIGAGVGLYFGLHKKKKNTKQCIVVIPSCSASFTACQSTGPDGCPVFQCQKTCSGS